MFMQLSRKQILVFIMLLAILLAMVAVPSPLVPVAVAESDGGSSDTGDSDTGSSGEDDEKDSEPGWLSGLFSSISRLVENIEKLLTGEILKTWFESWIISILDSLVNPVVNIWSKYMVDTPLIGPVGWVNKTWNLSLFYALPLFGLATIPLGWRLWSAKDSTGMKQPLTLFLKAAGGCMLTLYFIDFTLVLKNKVSLAMAQVWLKDAYGRLGQEPLSIEAMNGTMMLKAALIEQPENMDSAVTLGTAFYNELGLGWVFLTNPLLLIIGLVMLLSWVLLTLLGVSSPIYFGIAVIFNRMESIIGWINLTIRTIFIPFLFLIAWGICVSVHTPALSTDIGVSPVFVSILILGCALVISYYIWFKPAYKAVMSPITLNGGEVIEKSGAGLATVSEYSKLAAARLGFNRLESASQAAGEFGEKIQGTGAKMKQYGDTIRPNMSTHGPVIDRTKIFPTGSKTDRKTSGGVRNKKYWKDGHEYVTIENGLPVRNPSPPANGIFMGEYKE